MIDIPIIVITILIIMIIVGIIVLYLVWKRRSKLKITKEPDYRAFLIMGICFLPVGIIFTAAISPGFIGITGMGLIYMAIGLANRDKWKK